jgi:hypothetical protein
MIKPAVWYFIAPTTEFSFTARGGRAFDDKGPDHIIVYDHVDGSLVEDFTIPEDDTTHPYAFATTPGTIYRIEVVPGGGVDMDWTANYPMTRLCDENKPGFQADYSFYFYVPIGSTSVGGFTHATGVTLKRASGVVVATLAVADAYFDVAVPAGADGECWLVEHANQAFALLNVPTSTALHPSQLLLPDDVVAADGL